MEKKDMINRLTYAVQDFIDSFSEYGPDPVLAIDPKDFYMEVQTVADRDLDIGDSDATLEAAAAAEGLADQDGMDYQTGRNWDLYPLRELIEKDAQGRAVPAKAKILKIVEKYALHPDNSRTPYTE